MAAQMKIWLFEPYKWEYCGGAIAAIASSIEEARNLITAREKEEYDKYNHTAEFVPPRLAATLEEAKPHGEDGDYADSWLLTYSAVVADTEPRVLFVNYNYA